MNEEPVGGELDHWKQERNMMMPRQDTIVVGGGLAGLVIARELCAAGKTVTVVEARSRLGGRVYYDKFEGTGASIEFGGGWVAPNYQPRVAAEIDRYGLEIVEGQPGVQSRTLSGNHVLTGSFPVPPEDFVDLERAVWECLAASRRVEYGRPWEEQGLEDLDISWADFVRGLKLSPAVEEYLMNWTSASDPETSSALNVIALFATFGHSAWAAYNSMEHKFADGTASLVNAIASEVQGAIHLDTIVQRIEQTDEEVIVTATDGRTFTATAAVIALPINCWDDIEFVPPLSDGKRQVAKVKHVGTGQKVWMQLSNMPEGGVMGCGSGEEMSWLLRDRCLPEGDLYLAFTGGSRVDITDREAMTNAVRKYAPDASVLHAAEHNWNDDTFAKGVWAVFRPGHFTQFHSELSRPEGRLHFAGSDLSFGLQLWMEGAFETAFEVADRLLRRA